MGLDLRNNCDPRKLTQDTWDTIARETEREDQENKIAVPPWDSILTYALWDYGRAVVSLLIGRRFCDDREILHALLKTVEPTA